jgi:hypothetical protein
MAVAMSDPLRGALSPLNGYVVNFINRWLEVFEHDFHSDLASDAAFLVSKTTEESKQISQNYTDFKEYAQTVDKGDKAFVSHALKFSFVIKTLVPLIRSRSVVYMSLFNDCSSEPEKYVAETNEDDGTSYYVRRDDGKTYVECDLYRRYSSILSNGKTRNSIDDVMFDRLKLNELRVTINETIGALEITKW